MSGADTKKPSSAKGITEAGPHVAAGELGGKTDCSESNSCVFCPFLGTIAAAWIISHHGSSHHRCAHPRSDVWHSRRSNSARGSDRLTSSHSGLGNALSDCSTRLVRDTGWAEQALDKRYPGRDPGGSVPDAWPSSGKPAALSQEVRTGPLRLGNTRSMADRGSMWRCSTPVLTASSVCVDSTATIAIEQGPEAGEPVPSEMRVACSRADRTKRPSSAGWGQCAGWAVLSASDLLGLGNTRRYCPDNLLTHRLFLRGPQEFKMAWPALRAARPSHLPHVARMVGQWLRTSEPWRPWGPVIEALDPTPKDRSKVKNPH
jgi:hypothetical protein